MNIKIINDKEYSWRYQKVDGKRICFKGLFRYEDKCFRDVQACKKLSEIFSVDRTTSSSIFSLPPVKIFKENILKLRGHFSFIIDEGDFILAFVDKIRSYPIFYCDAGNTFFISNSALKIQAEADLHEKDEISFLEFEMAGFTTGRSTLFKDLLQLQAGEFLLYDKKRSNLETIRYYRYWTDEIIERAEGELLDELHEVTVKTFLDMIETLNGRPVWIPLSGGLDSRLVLAMLCEFKYDNISTFTYGIPGLWEIKEAKKIAEYLNVRWHYLPYKPKEIKKLFWSTERNNYFNFASGLSSAPFLSDFYALWILRNKRIISEDSIIINGMTGDYLTGGHIPHTISDLEKNELNVGFLLKAIIDKHFSLWYNLKTEENIDAISKKIISLLQLTPNSMISISEFAKYYELYEWQERQCKYVVNGQRMYEWFGYDWRLPLWSDELMDFWVQVDWQKKSDQKIYKKYLKQYNFGSVFDMISPVQYTYMPSYIKLLSKIFTGVGKITTRDTSLYNRKYLRYFMAYAPFYPQKSYFEYLKDSQWHRNCISYLAKNFLDSL
jgi:asparagine synthase (glutamine-hydrolysing)